MKDYLHFSQQQVYIEVGYPFLLIKLNFLNHYIYLNDFWHHYLFQVFLDNTILKYQEIFLCL
jgi:hypothetical protein